MSIAVNSCYKSAAEKHIAYHVNVFGYFFSVIFRCTILASQQQKLVSLKMEDLVLNVGPNGKKAESERSLSSHNIVQSTIQDLFEVQRNTLDHVRLTVEKQQGNYILKSAFEEVKNAMEHEKLDHMKTKLLLDKEKEELEFALSENKILKTQMQKEKEQHELQMRSLQSKASRETKRCDFLLEKCTEAEQKLDTQHDMLIIKDNEIADLKQRLQSQKVKHKRVLEEIDINKMQEDYMTKSLTDSQRRKREPTISK